MKHLICLFIGLLPYVITYSQTIESHQVAIKQLNTTKKEHQAKIDSIETAIKKHEKAIVSIKEKAELEKLAESAIQTNTVSRKSVNLLASADITSSVIRKLPPGTKIGVIEYDKEGFYKVITVHREVGYILNGLLVSNSEIKKLNQELKSSSSSTPSPVYKSTYSSKPAKNLNQGAIGHTIEVQEVVAFTTTAAGKSNM